MISRLAPAMVAFAVSALVAGCAGCTSNDSGAGGGLDSPASGRAEDGPIVIAPANSIDSLELQDFTGDAAYNVKNNVTAQPLAYKLKPGDDGVLQATPKVVGWAVESYELLDDDTKLVLHLREDAGFSDGSPITAKDVVYTLRRGIERPGSHSGPNGILGIAKPDQVKEIDERTVEIRLGNASPMTLQMFARPDYGILKADEYESHATKKDPWADDWAKSHVTSSGAYVLDHWTPGVEALLKPNPHFWDKASMANSGVLVKEVQSASERLALLSRGDLDIAYGLPTKDLEGLKSNTDVSVYSFPSNATVYLGMNQKAKPFDNELVRKAISYALPYDTMIESAMHGFADRLKSYVPEIMPTSDDSSFVYETDLDKARELLRQAGYPDGFEVELNVLAGQDDWGAAAVWIQSSLEQIGVRVKIQKLSDAEFFERGGEKRLPLFIHYFQSWVNDPYYQLPLLLQCDAFLNWTNYCNPEVDKLLKKGINNQDPSEREAISREIQALIMDDAPWGLLFTQRLTFAARSDITGITVTPDNYLRYALLGRKG